MKRTELVARLRRLQGDAYGAEPRAERIGEKCIAEHGDRGGSRQCFELGAMQQLTRELARGIDLLVADLARTGGRS